jgi:glycosyltransferase involved in cell wall biosynthesis
MRIAQIVLPGASQYERKSQRADFATLSQSHSVVTLLPESSSQLELPDAEIAHVYGPAEIPAALVRNLSLPWVSNAPVRKDRLFGKAPRQPSHLVSPLDVDGAVTLPEAVEEVYFRQPEPREPTSEPRVVGIFGADSRTGVRNAVEQAAARLQRFRDDVVFHLFDEMPAATDLAGVDLWLDPACDPEDFDGMVGEALVAGIPVVASRTPINVRRLEQGRTGFLVPVADPNKLTHAILTALFKPEVARARTDAARQTASKFRPRQRLRVLAQLYGTFNS